MEAAFWVLIPIAGILAGMFREWLKFKTKQRDLGASTHELEKEVAALKKALAQARPDDLVERIQNLEAIVASQTWDALHDKRLSPAERELKVASTARRELKAPEADTANQARVEQLARRLQG